MARSPSRYLLRDQSGAKMRSHCGNSQQRLPQQLTLAFSLAILTLLAQPSLSAPSTPIIVEVDAAAPSHPFPHFWEKMFGSGRAVLSLRESYRNDMRETQRITDFEYIRFHAIFHDEIGLYDEDKDGRAVYNLQYVDHIYDGLLENKVRPFIGLSFMPEKLTWDPNAKQAFWYK